MISWQLMNFSQTESKVRLYCGLRSRHRKDQGLREGVFWPFRPPSEACGSPSPRLFSNLHFAVFNTPIVKPQEKEAGHIPKFR